MPGSGGPSDGAAGQGQEQNGGVSDGPPIGSGGPLPGSGGPSDGAAGQGQGLDQDGGPLPGSGGPTDGAAGSSSGNTGEQTK